MNGPAPSEEELVSRLVAYDEARAAGLSNNEARDVSTIALESDPALEEFCRVLDLLDETLARHGLAEPLHVEGVDSVPRRLGRFRIARELGRGGFGVVYLAYDPNLRRRVALKLPRPEALLNPNARKRFLREARAAAALDHPHITPVYETGEIGDLCYLVSAYCAGGTLAEHLAHRATSLPIRTAARLIELLAGALHYAHQRGILHRDLKPANVLLEFRSHAVNSRISAEKSSEASGAWQELEFIPRLTDFGLARFMACDPDTETDSDRARRAAESLATHAGAMLGTPRYMAPEQIECQAERIGPATDVYALGVMLYECLVGSAPFNSPSKAEVLRQALTQEPASLRQRRPDVPRDLEAICLKCLEKQPERRYATMEALQADLGRFLRGEATIARPLSLWQFTIRWMRKRPELAALIAALAFAAAGLLGGLSLHSARLSAYVVRLEAAQKREAVQAEAAKRNLRLAEERALLARQQSYMHDITHAWRMWQEGRAGAICEFLDRHRPDVGEKDLRSFEWSYLRSLGPRLTELPGHRQTIKGVRFSPAGQLCCSWDVRGAVKVWQCPGGGLQASWQLAGQPLAMDFIDGGRHLLAVERSGAIGIWDAASGVRLATHPAAILPAWEENMPRLAAISPKGDEIAFTATRSRVCLMNLPSGSIRELSDATEQAITALRFSSDGALLAIARELSESDQSRVQVMDLAGGKSLHERGDLPRGIEGFSFSPNGEKLAAGVKGGSVLLWDFASKDVLEIKHGGPLAHLQTVFSPDGALLATGADNHASLVHEHVRLWNAATGTLHTEVPSLGKSIFALDFSPDGTHLAMGGAENQLLLCRLPQARAWQTLDGHDGEAWCAAFSADGALLASGGDDHAVKIWNASDGSELTTLTGHDSLVAAAAFSPDGRLLATSGFDHEVRLWDIASGKTRHRLLGHQAKIRGLAWHADGKLLASGDDRGEVRLWEASSGRLLQVIEAHTNKTRAMVFHPEQRRLFTAGEDGTICEWDTARPPAARRMQTWRESEKFYTLAIMRDGQLLAAGSREGILRLYSLTERKLIARFNAGNGGARSLAFSPDGKTLAHGGEDGAVKLWHVATRRDFLELPGVRDQVNGLAFSPDGQAIAAATHDSTVIVWRTRPEK